MKAKFRKEETINAILYLLKRMGGRCDIHKISKLLYFADRDHMMKYGRLITGDCYIAMNFGPVPSKIYDIFKYLRGDSYFSNVPDDITNKLYIINPEIICSKSEPDLDWLSESEVECLSDSVNEYGDKSFNELTNISHGFAWHNTNKDRAISYKDMLREVEAEEGYIAYVNNCIEAEVSPF